MARPLRSDEEPAPVPARAARRPRPLAEPVDRLVHEPVRLGILSALAAGGALSFAELKQLLRATDGNLSVHARKLEEAGLIACAKSFVERMPHTEYRLTAEGRKRLEQYLRHLEAVIRHARGA